MLIKHSERTVRRGCRECGSRDLYWAHDTDGRSKEEFCETCQSDKAFVLINKTVETMGVTPGTQVPSDARHNCKHGTKDPFKANPFEITDTDLKKLFTEKSKPRPPVKKDGTFTITDLPEPTQKEVKQLAPATTDTNPDVQAALGLLAEALGGSKVDDDKINSMIRAQLADIVFPTRTVIQKANGDVKKIEGSQHSKLADVITCLMAEEHVMMVGPAGTGKSTIAEQAAAALELPSYSISLSPQTPASQLLGYMQATGDYVPSLFRRAYEDGGVFHFDEIDNAHPSVLAVINSALANGHMAFPDKMVKRHSNFRAVASANTYGRGANRSYVGRQAIDAATLDRFSIETIEVDESLENELCHSIDLESDQVDRVLKFVRKLRKNVEVHNLPIVISPRASVGMCRLLAAGRSWESAVEARVRRGMSDTEWKKING